MKETKFIDQNKSKWKEFETLLDKKTKDPNRLSDLYVQITDDLSYSKTYYKNRLVRAYLNNLSQKVYLSVYKNKKTPLHQFLYFWKEELPFIIYQCRKELLISFIVFAFAVLVGALSVLNDPDYAEIVTSPGYVSMTKENIKNNDPMAVYKDEDSLNMFLRIAWNNIRVSFNVFVLGALAGVGSIFMLLLNGTMLGGFQFFFWDKGVFVESVITVWQHGTIEILCIIIAGGAGIVLGKGLIAPGTYPRLQSFQIAARKGIMIMISIMPFIVIAAFIEGFITRLTEAPLLFRLAMIILSLGVMVGYYIYYPYKKYKAGFDSKLKFEKTVESKEPIISFSKIKSSGEVFSDAFSIYTGNFGKHLLFAIVVGLVYGLFHLFYLTPEVYYIDMYDFWNTVQEVLASTFQKLFTFFKHTDKPLVLLSNVILIGSLLYMNTAHVMKLKTARIRTKKETAKLVISSLCLAAIINLVFLMQSGIMYVAFALLIPIAAILNISINSETNLVYGFKNGWVIITTKIFNSIVLWLMIAVIIFLFSFINTSTIVIWMVDFMSQNFLMDGDVIYQFYTFISAFFWRSYFCLNLSNIFYWF